MDEHAREYRLHVDVYGTKALAGSIIATSPGWKNRDMKEVRSASGKAETRVRLWISDRPVTSLNVVAVRAKRCESRLARLLHDRPRGTTCDMILVVYYKTMDLTVQVPSDLVAICHRHKLELIVWSMPVSD